MLSKLKSLTAALPLLVLALAPAASAQTWDTTGNSLLNGSYNFRQVYFEVGDTAGNFRRAVAMWGTISFAGNGNYTITNASVLDSSVGSVKSYSASGTYAISSSGFGFLDSPILAKGVIFGSVAQGIFLGSSTDDAVNDMFVAAQAPTTAPDNSAFNGSFWLAEMNFPTLTASDARDALFQIAANGQGGLANFTANGYLGNSGNQRTQAVTGGTYSFSAGVGTLNYGGTASGTSILTGSRVMFLSPNRNFVFGGSTSGYDMFVGVRALSGNATSSTLQGLYYQVGLDQDNSDLPNSAAIDTYYGAFKVSGTDLLGHQRVLIPASSTFAYDYTYSDYVTMSANGTHEDFFGFQNVVGADGTMRIGFGQGTYLGVHLAVRAPDFSGTGVYLNPTGVINAASSIPFTVGSSPGALMTAYGTNLSQTTAVDNTFPTTLGGVQVLVNNRPAPIYVVSPTQISFIVPYTTTEAIASFKVVSNSVSSNVVTEFMGTTSPGIFTVPPGGIGYAAALHPDYSVVTSSNPARPGETIAVYMTGMGNVNPPITAGTVSPTNPLSLITSQYFAVINNLDATVTYAGLAPQLISLYQMNITIPNGVSNGDVYLEIASAGAFNSQVVLPITGGVNAARPAARPDGSPNLSARKIVGRARPRSTASPAAGRVPSGRGRSGSAVE